MIGELGAGECIAMLPDDIDLLQDLPARLRFLAGGGEATRLILARDWSDHPMGPPEDWPDAFKAVLSTVLNSPESMILCWDRDDLFFFFNETYFPLLGPRLSWAMGSRFDEVWADAWAQARPIIDNAFAGASQRFTDLRWELATDRGAAETWWSFSYSRILDAAGEIAGLFIFTNETTARVQADEQIKVLNRELEHRLKNTLAMVQGIAMQTLKKGADLDTAREALIDRLIALARASDILTATSWESAEIAALARSVFAAHDGDGERIRLTGPTVSLRPKLALSLSLALHELATNATKYGALSDPAGVVDLGWTVTEGPNGDPDRFILTWRESGGPVVVAPLRQGFGSVLITKALRANFRGETTLDYRSGGLTFELSAPMVVFDESEGG